MDRFLKRRRSRSGALIALSCLALAVGMIDATPAAGIAGGTPASDGAYRFAVKIEVGGDRACSGALVAPQWVATAARCFTGGEAGQQVNPGAPALPTTAKIGRPNQAQTTGAVLPIVELVPRTDRNLVLAKLATTVTDIPPIPITGTAPAQGEALRVAGFGRTTTQWVPDQLHTAAFSLTTVKNPGLDLAAAATNTGLCPGDAGGPAFRESPGRTELLAIADTGFPRGCLGSAETRSGATATRVDDIADWIRQQTAPRVVEIANLFTKRCISVYGVNNVNNLPAQQYDCYRTITDRVWELEPVPGGTQIRNRFTRRCLAVYGADNVNNRQVEQYDCDHHATDRVWLLEPVAGGLQIRNLFTRRCLAVDGRDNVNNKPVVQYDCVASVTDRVWQLGPVPTSLQVRTGTTGACLSAPGTNNTNGAPAGVIGCDPTKPDRVWEAEPVTNGVLVRNRHTRRCLGVPDNSAHAGQVYQYDCDPVKTQQVWEIEPVLNGALLRNNKSRRCLGLPTGGSSPDGLAREYNCAPVAEQTIALDPTRIPDLEIDCKYDAPVFVTRPDGQLRLYKHTSPRYGDYTWANGLGEAIGEGWLGGRTVAGPDGVVYQATGTGELRRFRWNGTGWDSAPGGGQYSVLEPTGWDRYTTPQFRNRITVDTKGHIYTIEPDGKLHWRNHNPATGTWEHRILKDNWSHYDLIVAAGEGVIYGRTPTGELLRHVYDATTQKWSQDGKFVGGGWQMFNAVFSAGADTLYGARAENGGELLWYRYQPNNDTWAPGGANGLGRQIGNGWYGEYNLTAATDSCRHV
ncbi:ricin-type beta-trefoil lectin domain protein [Amycolatopsis thailandensis]|uniref:ricin-type beta-trefoil lectin domain protein n=1 Tax=Amycolatopsis thailandensis TaxID=589330 RepID=UPI003787ABD3